MLNCTLNARVPGDLSCTGQVQGSNVTLATSGNLVLRSATQDTKGATGSRTTLPQVARVQADTLIVTANGERRKASSSSRPAGT